eukprot:30897-Pelagococcus_subviridis.AAC.35
MPSPSCRGDSDQSDPWMPMVVDRPSYDYPTGCGRVHKELEPYEYVRKYEGTLKVPSYIWTYSS